MSSDVIILFGGASSERLVSVASAQNVSSLLPNAARWFLSTSGTIHRVPFDLLSHHARPFENEFKPEGAPLFSSLEQALDSATSQGKVFFLALHGGEGENGGLQAELEKRRLAFTGSGSKASAQAFDKAITKQLLGTRGVRLAEAELLLPGDASHVERILAGLFQRAPRWVLKPVADGSSVGLVHLRSRSEVPAAAKTLADAGVRYLAEAFVQGRELTVGVVDEPTGTIALPVSEVRVVEGGAFDYHGKYLAKGTEEVTPAPLTPTQRDQAQELGRLAHVTVGCQGYSRTDMILDERGVTFLEINTLPGLTKASFIPQQLAAARKDIRSFLEWQLELGRRRRDDASQAFRRPSS